MDMFMRMNRKIKGSITVFIAMISVVFISASLVMIDIARIIESACGASDSMALAVMSIDNSYNKEIFEDLDLLLYTGPAVEIHTALVDLAQANEDISNQGFKMEHNVSCCYISIAGEPNVYLFSQIDRSVKDRGLESIDTCHGLNNDPSYVYYDVYDTLTAPGSIEAVSRCCNGRNFYQLSYDYLSDMGAVSDEDYAERFYEDIMSWSLETDLTREDFNEASNTEDIRAVLENVNEYGKTAMDNRMLFRWYKDHILTTYEGSDYFIPRYDSFIRYMDANFGSFIDGKMGKSGLIAEQEYLLYGYQTDRENVAKVLGQIMQLRLFVNLNSLENESFHGEGNVVHALNEAWYDTLMLAKGASIPWIKSADTFVTDASDSFSDIEAYVELAEPVVTEGEYTYHEYLKNQFYLSVYSDQIVCIETSYTHLLDLLQYAYDIEPAESWISVYITDQVTVSEEDMDKAFSTLGVFAARNKTFENTYHFGE